MAYVDEGGVYTPTAQNQQKPGGTSLPGEGVYQDAQANAEQAYTDAMSSLQERKTQAYLRYGLNTNGQGLDPNNHYGLEQQSNRAFETGVSRENADYNGLQDQFSRTSERQGQDYQSILGKIGVAAGKEREDYGSILSRLGLSTDRENQAYGDTMADLTRAKDRQGALSGLTGRYDDSGNPTGLDLTGGAHGEYQQMLGSQARQLGAIRDASVSRGLGLKGVGNRELSAAAGEARDTRGGYRSQLLNSLVDEHVQEQRAGQSHGQALEDLRNSGSDALTSHNRTLMDLATQQSEAGTTYNRGVQDLGADQAHASMTHERALQDLGFNHGLNSQNMGLDLQDLKDGFDSEALGAQTTKTNSLLDARRKQILDALLAGGG